MGHSALTLVEHLPLLLAYYTAVGHYGAASNESEMTVYLGVVGLIREQLGHPVDFALHLVEMRVHIHALVDVALIEFSGELELLGSGSGGEAGNHGIELTAAVVPFFQQLLREENGLLGALVLQ